MAPAQVPALSGVNVLRSPRGCPGSAGAARLLSLRLHTKPWHRGAKPQSTSAAPVLSWAGGQPRSPPPRGPVPSPGNPP